MPSIPFESGIDLNGNEIENHRLDQRTSAPSNLLEGMIWWDSGVGQKHIHYSPDGVATVKVLRPDIAETVTAQWNLNGYFTVPGTTKITNLNADLVDGYHGSLNADANTVAVRGAGGRLKVAEPVAADDAATKGYVDAAVQGLDYKESCRVVLETNLANLSSVSNSQDGVTLVQGDRLLLVGQTDASENGIYEMGVITSGSGPISRAGDANSDAEVTSGMYTFIEEGTANSNTSWVLATADPITLDTTDLNFQKFFGAGSLNAGRGVVKSGDTLHFAQNSDYTVGDLFYAASTTTISVRQAVATGNVLLSQGAGVAPQYGKVGLTTHISGVLAVANGGTNSSTSLNNNRMMVSDSGAIVERAAITNDYIPFGYTSGAGGLDTSANFQWDRAGTFLQLGKTSGKIIEFDGGQAMVTVHDSAGDFNIKAGVDESGNVVTGTGSGGSVFTMGDDGFIKLATTTAAEGAAFADAIFIRLSTNQITHRGNTLPETDSTYDLGSTSVRWANGWFDAINSTAITGDGSGITNVNAATLGGVALSGLVPTSRTLTAGSGLTGGGDLSADRTFNVGAGDGISVAADTVAVDSTVVRTTGAQSVGGVKTFTSTPVISGTAPELRLVETDGSANQNWSAIVASGQLLIRTMDDAQTSFTTRLRLYQSGGVRLGSTDTDPGAGNLTVSGRARCTEFQVDAGEGLDIVGSADYFGSGADARLVRALDVNGTAGAVDGGLVFGGYTTSDSQFEEWLVLRNGTFTWKGDEIWHAGNLVIGDLGGTPTSRTLTAGSGLTGGGDLSADRTFNVGAGDGISVAADTVGVDSTVVRTTGAQSIAGIKTFTSAPVISGNAPTIDLHETDTTDQDVQIQLQGGALTFYTIADDDSVRYNNLTLYSSGAAFFGLNPDNYGARGVVGMRGLALNTDDRGIHLANPWREFGLFPGSDLNWKKVARIQLAGGDYGSVSVEGMIVDLNANTGRGQTRNVSFSGYVTNDLPGAGSDRAEMFQGYAVFDYVRFIRTAANDFELQIRQRAAFKGQLVRWRVLWNYDSAATITYHDTATLVDGATTGTAYAPSTPADYEFTTHVLTHSFHSVYASHLRLPGTGEASLSSTTHALQIGTTAGYNLILDNDEIQTRNSGSSAVLRLNPAGGNVEINGNVAWHTGNLTIGDLSGVPTSRTLTAGDGLSGGGDLSANRSFAVDSTVIRTTGDQTMSGIKSFSGRITLTAAAPDIRWLEADTTDTNWSAVVANGQWILRTVDDAQSSFASRFRLYQSGGLRLGGTDADPGTNKLYVEGNVTSVLGFNLIANDGIGLRFWDSDSFRIHMSAYSSGTWGGRLDSTSDYNMYFRMTGGTNRGWVFQNGTTPVFQVESTGQVRTASSSLLLNGKSAARVYSETIGNGSDVNLVVTHGLGTRDVVVEVRRVASPYDKIMVHNEANSTSQVTLKFGSAPSTNEYRVTVTG